MPEVDNVLVTILDDFPAAKISGTRTSLVVVGNESWTDAVWNEVARRISDHGGKGFRDGQSMKFEIDQPSALKEVLTHRQGIWVEHHDSHDGAFGGRMAIRPIAEYLHGCGFETKVDPSGKLAFSLAVDDDFQEFRIGINALDRAIERILIDTTAAIARDEGGLYLHLIAPTVEKNQIELELLKKLGISVDWRREGQDVFGYLSCPTTIKLTEVESFFGFLVCWPSGVFDCRSRVYYTRENGREFFRFIANPAALGYWLGVLRRAGCRVLSSTWHDRWFVDQEQCDNVVCISFLLPEQTEEPAFEHVKKQFESSAERLRQEVAEKLPAIGTLASMAIDSGGGETNPKEIEPEQEAKETAVLDRGTIKRAHDLYQELERWEKMLEAVTSEHRGPAVRLTCYKELDMVFPVDPALQNVSSDWEAMIKAIVRSGAQTMAERAIEALKREIYKALDTSRKAGG